MIGDPDVLVVGGGPVGVTTALLLTQRGFDVRVIERDPEVYDLPRAIVMDDEIQHQVPFREQLNGETHALR